GVRAGVELMLGWACADNACTSVWACTPSGLVREDTRCLVIASCLVEGFGGCPLRPYVGRG
uniref:Uncharacterized protein n=1 Tax=Cucumis melo TaxID=3656 RepID=A0A9I9E9I4_CUCME